MKRILLALTGLVALGASSAQAVLLKYPECVGKYPADATWDAALEKHWADWKTRFLGSDGVVKATDPSYNESNVSEAQSYAMLLAVWFNDQAAFDKAYKAAESNFWAGSCGTGGWYGWKKPVSGCTGNGSYAPDADQDIAGALIFASVLQDKSLSGWTGTKGTYKAKAITVMKSVWANMVDKNNYLLNTWNGSSNNTRNPSYHMPAWYQVFSEFAAANGVTGQDWDKVRTAAYGLMESQPGASMGMARNFCGATGGSPDGGTSSPNNYDMGFDAIRVPYRMGMDAMWYPKHSRAVAWCKSVWQNAPTSEAGPGVYPDQPGMYTIGGSKLWGWGTYPAFTDAEYEKSLTNAMWGTAAIAVKDSATKSADAAGIIKSFVAKQLKARAYFSGYESEDVASNYYAQTLALMGALAMSGRAWNVWDDAITPCTPPVVVTTKITTALKATPASIQQTVAGQTPGTVNQTKLTATLNQSAAWTLHLEGATSGATFDTAATSSSIELTWSSNRKQGVLKFGIEKVNAQLTFADQDQSTSDWKTSIDVTASLGGVKRARPANWSVGGLQLLESQWHVGDHVQVSVRDLTGRSVVPVSQATFIEAPSGVVLDLNLPASVGVRVLEVTDPVTRTSSQYILSPKL